MEKYKLREDEIVVFRDTDIKDGYTDEYIDLMLTNINIVEQYTVFRTGELIVEVFPLNEIKVHDGKVQIHHKNAIVGKSTVDVYFKHTEKQFIFDQKGDALKFVEGVIHNVSGKKMSERGLKAVKEKIDLVDNTFEVDTVGAIKSFVTGGGIKGALFKGLKSSKDDSGHVEEGIELVKDVINSKNASNNSEDNFSQIKKIKELYDAGMITEEEYEIKKKQILGI